jgi:energy-coupling factor transport system ATP-binding protein
MEPFLVFEDVSFQYPSEQRRGSPISLIPALNHISLEINQGEFIACIGANGSGKSTFARLADALLIPTLGTVKVTGLDTRQPKNHPKIHAAVGMVFQFPEDQIISTTVEEDVAFGPENLAFPPQEIRERVDQALQETGLWEIRQRSPQMLSAGQIQRVALAGVLAMTPRCIIFDEATTMLDPAGRRAMTQAIQRLHGQGTTILFITHSMEEAALAERLLVFDRGALVEDGPPEQIFADPENLGRLGLDLPPAARLARAISKLFPQVSPKHLNIANLLAELPDFPGTAVPWPAHAETIPGSGSATEIEVEGLGYHYMRGTPLEQRALEGVFLQAAKAEVHGLAGRTGSGKSTLMQHLNGLLRPQEGRVRVGGFDLSDGSLDRRDIVRNVGLVFQNPEAQFFEHYAGDEIAFGPRQLKIAEPGNPLLAERVRWAMEKVGLDFEEFKDRPLFTLSGGERRKVALASTLALQPSILLLDEPTAGLDPRSRRELLARLADMSMDGMTILLSSHQMEDIALLAQSVTVMSKGKVALSGKTGEVFSNPGPLDELGLDLPAAAKVAAALRVKGWPIPQEVITHEDLIQVLEDFSPFAPVPGNLPHPSEEP